MILYPLIADAPLMKAVVFVSTKMKEIEGRERMVAHGNEKVVDDKEVAAG